MRQYLEFKNISTILTSIFLTIFGLILGYATSQGLNLPFTAETATTVTVGVILFAFSYFNAKHQNNLFDSETDTIYLPIDGLTDGQVKAINNYIENIIEKNLEHQVNIESRTYEKYNDAQLESIDPSLAYEDDSELVDDD